MKKLSTVSSPVFPVVADPKAIAARRNGGRIAQKVGEVREDTRGNRWREEHGLQKMSKKGVLS